jgi:hypothetical protein
MITPARLEVPCEVILWQWCRLSHVHLLAFAIGVFGNHRGLTLAIVAVGLAVATAHRPEDFRTEPRDPRACAGHVDDAATSGFLLAEQAGVALNAGEAAAGLADTNGLDGGRGEHHQPKRYGKRQGGFGFQAFLPILLDT